MSNLVIPEALASSAIRQMTNNCQLAHINIMILKVRQIWFCDDGISGCIQVENGRLTGYPYGSMLTDYDLVLSLIIGQVPKLIFALILNVECRYLQKSGEGFILLGWSDIAALSGICTENSVWI